MNLCVQQELWPYCNFFILRSECGIVIHQNKEKFLIPFQYSDIAINYTIRTLNCVFEMNEKIDLFAAFTCFISIYCLLEVVGSWNEKQIKNCLWLKKTYCILCFYLRWKNNKAFPYNLIRNLYTLSIHSLHSIYRFLVTISLGFFVHFLVDIGKQNAEPW